MSGPVLTAEETALFAAAKPLGFILFDKDGARNIQNPQQLRALIKSLKDCVGWNCPILIDQEGGRVQRMKAPHWRAYPPGKVFGDQAAEETLEAALESLRFNTLQMADDLVEVGINVTCSPVLDLVFPGAHDIIGDRAFGADPALAGRLGLSLCRHYLAAGVTPVIKHIPGHGRAEADSHLALPRVKASHADLAAADFMPFKMLSESDVGSKVWGMTAHVVYEDLDADHPATTSQKVMQDIIRGEIGFAGFLLGDDLDMKALDIYGDLAARADACLTAGCDALLYCSGRFADMELLSKSVSNLTDTARKRLQNAAFLA
ncbi:MAG: beta-N-acetylhexosaminidase [Alphaproteobacteria bacterium]|nr:beta-N-acetylhexosaminidase [Alphaproteobacteria bacterium]